jgi:hypothetical protein
VNDLISRQAAIDAIHNYWEKRIDTLPTRTTEDGEAYDTKSLDEILEHNKILVGLIKAIPSYKEADRKTEPTISKMEQVEDELQTERSVCDTCQWYNSGIPCGIKPSVCKREVKDEPTEAIQGTGDCDHCPRLFVDCDGR